MSADTENRGMDRRAALVGLACSALVCSTFPGAVLAQDRELAQVELARVELNWARRLAGVFGVQLSNDALNGNDRVATIITLTARILGFHLMTPPRDMTDLELKRLLRARVAESFASGRLRCVDGWWLSETQADAIELLECLRK
jgi:hypothetical protein